MARNCEIPSEFRSDTGLSQNFFNSVRKSPVPEKLTKEQVRNLVKNIGIDDARAIELRSGKEHIFGRNLRDIKEWDAAKQGNIPKDTLVKKPNKDGDIEYFVSERPTQDRPSKWIVNDGQVMPNPDWTYVGKNATVDRAGALKRYSHESGNIFKEDPEGDVVLKVGKLYEGSNPPPNYKLAEDGYDGVKLSNGNIRTFHQSQVVNPKKVFIRDTYEGTSKQTVKNEATEEKVAKELETLGVGKRVAAVGAGALVGEIAADEYGGSWLGGAIGLALTMPSAVTKMKGLVKEGALEADDFAKLYDKAQRLGKDYRELREEGYNGHPLDEEAKTEFKEKWLNSKRKSRAAGESVKDAIFNNDYITSGLTRLKNLGIQSADKMMRILGRAETAHNPYMAIVKQEFEKNFNINTYEDLEQIEADLLRRFMRQTVGESEAVKPTDEYLSNLMGGSIRRIITHEAELDEAGKLVFRDEDVAAKTAYSNKLYRNRDKFVLQTEEGRKLVDSYRNTFDRMGQKITDSYDRSIKRTLEELEDADTQVGRVFRNYYDSKQTIKQWRQTARKKAQQGSSWIKQYEEVKDNKIFKELVQLRQKQLKIQKLKGRYVPQVQDNTKIAEAKKRFIENNPKLKEATPEEQELAWFDHFKKLIIGYNTDGFTVKQLSDSGMDVETRYYKNFDKAVREFKNDYAYDILDKEVRQQVIRDLESDDPIIWEQYIGEKRVNGNPVYFLKNPDKIQREYDYNILDDINAGTFGQAQRTFLNMALMKKSSYLDNPRNYILPDEFLQNNMQKTIQHYARDVGVKTHLMDNNVGTQRQLEKFLSAVRSEAKQKGITDTQDAVDRVHQWYSVITNTRLIAEADMSPQQIIRNQRQELHNNKIKETIMKLAAMPFMWFTSFYAPFTPAILGSYLSSPKAIAKAYKEVFKDPQALRNMTDSMYKYGAIKKKASSISEFAQFGSIGKETLTGSDNWFVDAMHNIADRGFEFSTRFSLSKQIASKLGLDVENAGLFRLVSGDLFDITGAESAMVNMAVFRELEDMTEAGIKMLSEGTQEAVGGGKTFKMSTIKRRLEDLGVDNPERFIRESQAQTEEIKNISRFYNSLTKNADSSPISDYLTGEYSRVMDSVINKYHGRTKLTRPLKWVDNPYGRVLSQFSVYAQNFGVQTVRNRIYRPLKEWNEKHAIKQKDASLWSIYWNMQRGNDQKIKQIFGENWKEAYNDFPTEAVDAIFKITPVAFGAGAVMGATRDSVLDMVNMVSNEAVGNDDYEAWERTKETFAWTQEIDDGITGFEVLKATSGMLGQATHMGYFSRAGQVLRSARYGSLADVTPATNMMNEAFDVMGEPFRGDWKDVGERMSRKSLEYILLRSPVIGSFNGLRETAVDAAFNKPNSNVNFGNDGSIDLESL